MNNKHQPGTKSDKFFPILMRLVALHSFAVGCALVVLPASVLSIFGFPEMPGNFFQVQGGVFHIVMCVAYLMASFHPHRFSGLVYFSIAAKLMATVFLFSYYFAVQPFLVVLLSGIGDLIMGIVIFAVYRSISGNRL